MGKTEKKVKSERINALRKQYDAFLEEDKKRKERNEYILGRLDKMRMSTAIVVRNRMSQIEIDQHRRTYEKNVYDDKTHTSLIPVRSYASCRLEDNDILKEISKRYILIPKQTSFSTEQLLRHEVPIISESNDWKSKYDILTKLKQEESSLIPDDDVVSLGLASNQIERDIRRASDHLNLDHVPIKDSNVEINENKTFYQGNLNVSKKGENNDLLGHDQDQSDDSKQGSGVNNLSAVEYDKQPDLKEIKLSDHNDTNVSSVSKSNDIRLNEDYLTDPTDSVIYANVTKKNPSDDSHESNREQRADCDNDESAYYAQDINNEFPLTSETNHIDKYYCEKKLQDTDKFADAPEVEYEQAPQYESKIQNDELAEISQNYDNSYYSKEAEVVFEDDDIKPITQTQDLSENIYKSEMHKDILKIEDSSPKHGVVVVDGEKINSTNYDDDIVIEESHDPEYPIENIPVSEDPVDVSQINEFEEENKHMFYSEEHDVNHEQYNIKEGIKQNEEQPRQDGAYDENGQYIYYEGTAQDQTYAVEYGENEAAMQPYDQTYEQQYGDTPYEQQQYDQGQYVQQQVVEQPHIYENVEQYSEPENISPEEIQQQLDNEQGYTEQVLATEEAITTSVDENTTPTAAVDVKPVETNQKQ